MAIGSEIIGNKKTHHQTAIPTEDSQPLLHLPQEIIFDILSRLPIKSLLRFQRLVLNAYPNRTGRKSCLLDSIMECKLPENAVEFDYPSKEPNQFVYIVGSCNGLMCVAADIWSTNKRTIYLWNPSTRKSKRLPDLGVRRGWNWHDLYGFGFDESNDDYKVVLTFCDSGGGVSADRKVMVCTLRTDSWRQIGGFSCDVPFGVFGKFLNGSIHWVARDN
ncbi:F-box/kelch-repeat protein At3g06240-like [Rhododendron vialii]|uniref:F-box/kelch-repeat protein At3g06240-like n=1 Tax=Rhododendron vialii TaxID=182163 RepID=UPI00265DE694|nr:F-box/kelch-repeat protein At3g06240-like [Rhododendron vialii]